MSMHVSSVEHELAVRDSRRREVAQQLPRPARIRLVVATEGVGETRLAGSKGLDFGAYLLEEPSFSFGVVLNQPSLPTGALPVATAVVLKWKKNKNGMYVGADMGFCVHTPFTATTDASQPTAKMRLQFSLTFEASSLRSTWGTGGSGAGGSGDGSAPVFQGNIGGV